MMDHAMTVNFQFQSRSSTWARKKQIAFADNSQETRALLLPIGRINHPKINLVDFPSRARTANSDDC